MRWPRFAHAAKFGPWPELERQAQASFEAAYGTGAPPTARTIGSELQVRVTFGWAALREKLVAADCGLNDVELELTKLVLIRGSDGSTIADDTELRLIDAHAGHLTCAWVRSASDEVIEAPHVPRALYDEVAVDREGFAALRASLGAGPFVDMNRLLVDIADAA